MPAKKPMPMPPGILYGRFISGYFQRSRTNDHAVTVHDNTKAVAEKLVIESTRFGPKNGPMQDKSKHTICPFTAIPLLFCFANTSEIRRPRDMLINKLAAAVKNPFHVVNNPAIAPIVSSQYKKSPVLPGKRRRNIAAAAGCGI